MTKEQFELATQLAKGMYRKSNYCTECVRRRLCWLCASTKHNEWLCLECWPSHIAIHDLLGDRMAGVWRSAVELDMQDALATGKISCQDANC
jgi:hypothetical protein